MNYEPRYRIYYLKEDTKLLHLFTVMAATLPKSSTHGTGQEMALEYYLDKYTTTIDGKYLVMPIDLPYSDVPHIFTVTRLERPWTIHKGWKNDT